MTTLRAIVTHLAARVDGRDVVLVLALALIGAGVGAWSPPAASVIVGALLLWLAWPPAPPTGPPRGAV